MNRAFIITFFLFSINAFAQQDTVFIVHDSGLGDEKLKYVTDTVIFPGSLHRHILIGTTILPETYNQQIAKNYGLWFEKVTSSDCQHQEIDYEPSGWCINSLTNNDTMLIFDVNIIGNCCYSFLCDISVTDSSVLHLNYTGYGNHCDCDCCFGLTYYI